MKKVLPFIILVIANTLSAQQWKPNGPFGGRIACLTTKQNAIYAGTSNGVFKSTNNGADWVQINNGLQNSNMYSLCVANDRLFAGTAQGLYQYDGTTWIKNTKIPDIAVQDLTKYANSLFVATDRGVYISGDMGDTWISINKGIGGSFPAQCLCVAATSNDVYLSTSDGMCIFNPVDSSWLKIKDGLPTILFGKPYQIQILDLAVRGNKVFASNLRGVFIFDKTENVWKKKAKGLDTLVRCIAVSDKALYAGNDNGQIYVSSDDAETWSKLNNTGLPKDNIYDLAFKDNLIFAGLSGLLSKGGVYTSDKNANWKESSNGISPLNGSSLLLSDTSLFASGYGVYKSVNNGQTWSEAGNGLVYTYFTSIQKFDNKLFAGSQTDGVYRSLNNGNTWFTFNNGLSNKNIICIGKSNTKLYAGTKGGGVFESNGTNWLPILKDLPNKNVNALLVSDTTIIVSTDSGVCFYEKNGINWLLKGVRLPNRKIYSLITFNEQVITATDSGIFVSGNNGSDWLSANSGLTNQMTKTLLAYENKVFVGTENGVFMSEDSVKTWVQVNGGFPLYITVNSLQVSEKTIYACTNNGIWSRAISDIGLNGLEEKLSKQTLKIYPNPAHNYLYFSSENTRIKQATIYDCQGKILLQQNLVEYRINLEQLLPGLYFLRAFDTNENAYTAKFIKD